MLQATPPGGIGKLVGAIAASLTAGLYDRPRSVAQILASLVPNMRLLDGLDCRPSATSYTRHKLHTDPAGRFGVAALVWMPGQRSPVHAHKTWCALGIHRGELTETFFAPGDPPRPLRSVARSCGDVSHGEAGHDSIHCLENRSGQEAISIHVYGVAFERFAQDVNLLFT